MGSLRTLVIGQNLPYPTFAGMDLRNWQNINGLARIGEVGVFGLHSNDPRSKKEPPLSLGFWRASTDPALTYPLPKKKLLARAWLLTPLGHPSDLYYSDAAASEIVELMESFRPERRRDRGTVAAPLHSAPQAPPLPHCAGPPQCGRSKVSADWRVNVRRRLQARLFREILPGRVRVIEHQAANAVDQIWVCSQEDARLLEEVHQPSAPIHVVPNTVDVDHYESVRARLCPRPESVAPTRRTLIFPAVFQWEPNAAAANFLIEEFFPDFAQVFPDCQLLLVGGLPTPSMMDAAKGDQRIVVTGVVPDVLPFFAAASVMVVPVLQGGGTRLKILEGFAANVPVVSTHKGAEGLAVEERTHLLFAEDVREFVDAVKQIWTEEGPAKHLAANGLDLVTHAYSWNVSSRRIIQAIAALDGGA